MVNELAWVSCTSAVGRLSELSVVHAGVLGAPGGWGVGRPVGGLAGRRFAYSRRLSRACGPDRALRACERDAATVPDGGRWEGRCSHRSRALLAGPRSFEKPHPDTPERACQTSI